MTSIPPLGLDNIRDLIERSSLGEPGAVQLRRRTPHELADAIVDQAGGSFHERRLRERAMIFSRLRSGDVTLTWVLDHADNNAMIGRFRVVDVLRALPQRVPRLAENIMEVVGISPNRRLRGLGTRQRSDLLGLDAAGVFDTERPAGSQEAPRWDFFVSYTETDARWAEWIAWHLTKAGYRVLIRAWDFTAGSDLPTRLRDGVEHSARTIVVLSAHSAQEAARGTAEWQIALWTADPDEMTRRLLVARVADCAPPGPLAQAVSLDLFDQKESQAQEALLRAAELAVPGGRAGPSSTPPP